MANHNITLTATDKTRGTLQNVDKNLDRVTRRSLMFKGALGLAGGALAALGAMKIFGSIITDMDELAKSARNVGVTTEREFAKFQVIKKFTEEAGISTSEFDRSMRNLQTRMEQGLNGNKTYAEIMSKLGDSIFDANGELKSTPDLFTAVGTAMQEGTINLSDAQKLLGEMVGPKIFQAIQQLTNDGVGLGEALAEVAGSMNIIALEDAQQAEKFGDALQRVKDAGTALLTEAITPLLGPMTTFLQDLAAKAPEYLQMFNDALAASMPFLNTMTDAFTTVLLPVLNSIVELFGLAAGAIVTLYEKDPLITALAVGITALGVAIKLLNPFSAILLAIGAAWAGISYIVEEMGGWGVVMDKITEIVSNMGTAIVEIFNNIKTAVSDLTEGAINKVIGWWEKLSNVMYKNSIVPDLKDAIIDEFKEIDEGVTLTTAQTVDSVISDYDRLLAVMDGKTSEMAKAVKTNMDKANDYIADFNKSFNDTLVDGLVDGNLSFDTFAGLWKDTLKDLLKDTLNGGNMLSDIMGGIFGGGGGGGGGLFSSIGSLFGGGGGGGLFSGISDFFGGFFANGGHLPAGKFGIAGEAGPEIITGPARVMSNEDSFGGGGMSNVNITIQAIDTQTGTEFLLNNKKQIEGIIQNAYNRRGKQGIY